MNKWYQSGESKKGKIDLKKVSDIEWNFIVGKEGELIEKLNEMDQRLGDVARIFQGLVTGADKVFILDSPGKIEKEILHPFLKSDSIIPYGHPEVNKCILFPYYIQDGKATLIPKSDFVDKYPNGWEYLTNNQNLLKGRERGKWNNKHWYAFGRSQNLTQMDDPKLIIQVLSLSPRWIYDDRGLYMTGGGGGPFYGLKPLINDVDIFYLLGILNSKLFGFIISNQSTKMRGGYIRYSKQYIEKAPIPMIDFKKPDDISIHDEIVKLVKSMIQLHKELESTKNPTSKQSFHRQINATDKQINKLVYELYGLTDEEIKIVEDSLN